MPYLGISWLKFLKTIVIFEIGTFKFVKNEFLAHAVNFGIGPDFTFGPGFGFSEGPSPGSGLVYEVCPICWNQTLVFLNLYNTLFEKRIGIWKDSAFLFCTFLQLQKLVWFFSSTKLLEELQFLLHLFMNMTYKLIVFVNLVWFCGFTKYRSV